MLHFLIELGLVNKLNITTKKTVLKAPHHKPDYTGGVGLFLGESYRLDTKKQVNIVSRNCWKFINLTICRKSLFLLLILASCISNECSHLGHFISTILSYLPLPVYMLLKTPLFYIKWLDTFHNVDSRHVLNVAWKPPIKVYDIVSFDCFWFPLS